MQQLDQADLAGGPGVHAAAEFGGEVADLDDADLVAVLFAEERHGFVFVHSDVNGNVFDDLDFCVGKTSLLTMSSMSWSSSSATPVKWEKSKRRRAGSTSEPCLLHVLAQHFAQRGVQQVRTGVVADGGEAHLGVDHGGDPGPLYVCLAWRRRDARARLARHHASANFCDYCVAVIGVEPSGVADLSAGVSVEGRVV